MSRPQFQAAQSFAAEEITIFFPKPKGERGVLRMRGVLSIMRYHGVAAPVVFSDGKVFNVDPRAFVTIGAHLVYSPFADAGTRSRFADWLNEHPDWTADQVVEMDAEQTDFAEHLVQFLDILRRWRPRELATILFN